jgi:hypothetical protein
MGSTALKSLWLVALVAVFFLFIAYSTMLPIFGDKAEMAWQWLMPNLLPPFGLVFGLEITARASKGADKTAIQAKAKTADAATWSVAISAVYLVVLLFSAISMPFADDPIGFLNRSNFWLTPLLAVTTAVLGARLAKA